LKALYTKSTVHSGEFLAGQHGFDTLSIGKPNYRAYTVIIDRICCPDSGYNSKSLKSTIDIVYQDKSLVI
jgi:hypothetical protein